jgi:hypothetical protein
MGAHDIGREIRRDGVADLLGLHRRQAIRGNRRVDYRDIDPAKKGFGLLEETGGGSGLGKVDRNSAALADFANPLERVIQMVLFRPQTKTLAPSLASNTAVARPMPVVPPVMATFFPLIDVCAVCASLNMNWFIVNLRQPYAHAIPDVPPVPIIACR